MESRQNIWDLWSCSYTLKYSSTSALLTILQGTVSCLLYVCRRFKQPPKYPVALWIWVTKSQTHMLRNNAHTQTFLVSCQSFTANTCRPLKVGSADLLVSVEAATLQGGPRAQIKSWSSSELLAINVCSNCFFTSFFSTTIQTGSTLLAGSVLKPPLCHYHSSNAGTECFHSLFPLRIQSDLSWRVKACGNPPGTGRLK